MIGRLIGTTGLMLGLLSGSVAIAAEPPVLSVDDLKNIDTSEILTGASGAGATQMYTAGFSSTFNSTGDLFVHRYFMFEFRNDSKLINRTISLVQIDCSSKRRRDMLSNFYSFQPEFSSQTREPGEWRNYEVGTVEDNSCAQAYRDRALAGR